MSIYLPLGIGLFQAQNQQLLIVSQEQNHLIHSEEFYRPLVPDRRTVGSIRHWIIRLKVWWNSISQQGKYEGLVFAGITMQVGFYLPSGLVDEY